MNEQHQETFYVLFYLAKIKFLCLLCLYIFYLSSDRHQYICALLVNMSPPRFLTHKAYLASSCLLSMPLRSLSRLRYWPYTRRAEGAENQFDSWSSFDSSSSRSCTHTHHIFPRSINILHYVSCCCSSYPPTASPGMREEGCGKQTHQTIISQSNTTSAVIFLVDIREHIYAYTCIQYPPQIFVSAVSAPLLASHTFLSQHPYDQPLSRPSMCHCSAATGPFA